MPGRVVIAGQRLEQERCHQLAGYTDLLQQLNDPRIQLGVAEMGYVELARHVEVELLAIFRWVYLGRGFHAGFNAKPGALDILVIDDPDYLAIFRPGRPVAGRIVGDLDGLVEDRIGIGDPCARV